MSINIVLLQLIVLLINSQLTLQAKQPHIIFIMADDLGWNDVGFHGSGQIPTPNIDALAYSGLILNNYYVSPICSPSRSALMTGKYPIHTGMQHHVLLNQEPRGLPINERLLPEYLRSLGYATHIVGKWHLGSYKNAFTPTQRGFDTFLGYLGALQDYFDHTCVERSLWGLDMRRGLDTAWDLHGKYSTDIFTEEAVRLIETHNSSSPMFLYLSHAAVHPGNPYNYFPVPDDDVERVTNVTDYRRRRYAAMMLKLDDSVGQVVEALHRRGILNDSVIVFASDNGGSPSELEESAASNWPLRGAKFTLWEGGVRAAALLWSTKISRSQRVADQLMHISDWLPTLYGLAGGNSSSMGDIDGVDMWESLSENKESSRSEVLHNIDDIEGTSALRVGEWKIVKGAAFNGTADVWFGPSGREYEYDIQQVLNSQTAQILDSIGKGFTVESALQMRNDSDVRCKSTNNQTSREDTPCYPLIATCLFNIHDDPCEYNNLAEKYPEILQKLQQTLSELNATAIPPGDQPLDPLGNPKYWNYTWTNFGDYLGYDDTTEPVLIDQS